MKMEHFVLGLVFNQTKDRVLLIEKRRPEWMAGKWNGIGGHIEEDETPGQAMIREAKEECGHSYLFEHKITFTCPGGTMYVFAAIYPHNIINYKQIEDEQLSIWNVPGPEGLTMDNLKWIIPLCLSTIQFPVILQQNELGVSSNIQIKLHPPMPAEPPDVDCSACGITDCDWVGTGHMACIKHRSRRETKTKKACCGNCRDHLQLGGCPKHAATTKDGCCIDHKFL